MKATSVTLPIVPSHPVNGRATKPAHVIQTPASSRISKAAQLTPTPIKALSFNAHTSTNVKGRNVMAVLQSGLGEEKEIFLIKCLEQLESNPWTTHGCVSCNVFNDECPKEQNGLCTKKGMCAKCWEEGHSSSKCLNRVNVQQKTCFMCRLPGFVNRNGHKYVFHEQHEEYGKKCMKKTNVVEASALLFRRKQDFVRKFSEENSFEAFMNWCMSPSKQVPTVMNAAFLVAEWYMSLHKIE